MATTIEKQRVCRIDGDVRGRVNGELALYDFNITWPPFVATAFALSVWIDFDAISRFSRISSANYAIVNRVLYSLACFVEKACLLENHKRTMTVDIEDNRRNRIFLNSDSALHEKVFYSLAKIPKSVDLQLGDYFKGIEPAINTLRMDPMEENTLRFKCIDAWKHTVVPYKAQLARAFNRLRDGRETPASQAVIFHKGAMNESTRIMSEELMSLEMERCIEACVQVMGNAVRARETEKREQDRERREQDRERREQDREREEDYRSRRKSHRSQRSRSRRREPREEAYDWEDPRIAENEYEEEEDD